MHCPIHKTKMTELFTSSVCDLCSPPVSVASTKTYHPDDPIRRVDCMFTVNPFLRIVERSGNGGYYANGDIDDQINHFDDLYCPGPVPVNGKYSVITRLPDPNDLPDVPVYIHRNLLWNSNLEVLVKPTQGTYLLVGNREHCLVSLTFTSSAETIMFLDVSHKTKRVWSATWL